MMMTINQSIIIPGLHTYMLLDVLLFGHSEQSMDSHRQAYFHDRPNVLLIQIDVGNLPQDTIFMQYIQYSGKQG